MSDSEATGLGVLGVLFGGVFFIVMIAIWVVMVASMWKVFVKAGQPGWAAIVPVYNAVILLQIIGKPLWWIILLLIPLVNFVVMIMVTIDLAKSFGKSTGFAFGLLLLSFIFFPILGFGDARYPRPGRRTGRPGHDAGFVGVPQPEPSHNATPPPDPREPPGAQESRNRARLPARE